MSIRRGEAGLFRTCAQRCRGCGITPPRRVSRLQQSRRLHSGPPSAWSHAGWSPAFIGVGLFGLGLTSYWSSSPLYADSSNSKLIEAPDEEKEEDGAAPIFRLAEVKQHGPEADEIWVIKGTGVYNITDWIDAHPGGKVILRGAGANIEPYWNIFTIHQKQEVYDILESYRIGDVDPRDLIDGAVPDEEVEDPFEHDPERDKRLHTLSARPFNAETPGEYLTDYITPKELFYVRNHLWVPEPTPASETYELTIELPSGDEKTYTLSDLRTRFPQRRITATLQCSGNRRKHMSQQARQAQGLQWDVGGIGTATWTGVLLRDVLRDAGLEVDETTIRPRDPSVQHVLFTGSEAYGASIPVAKALDPYGDTLLAFEMNGQPLDRDHGAPLRAVVPGITGARWTKWLNRISLGEEESTSQWQRRDYKCFGPGEAPDDSGPKRAAGSEEEGEKHSHVTWDDAPAIQETPVQSAITGVRKIVAQGKAVQKLRQVYGLDEDAIEVSGYAFAGGGREIVRVDVSLDGGHTWRRAETVGSEGAASSTDQLSDQGLSGAERNKGDDGEREVPEFNSKAWAWKRWSLTVPRRIVGTGKEICVKAVDEANNVQPEGYEASYNFRGNLTTAWHRVRYEAKDA